MSWAPAVQQAWVAHRTLADACALAAAAACAAGAWAAARAGAARPAATLLSALALVAGLAMSADDFLHPWDERFHAVVARHLLRHPLVPTLYAVALHPPPATWTEGHVWVHKPPVPLWLMAASLALNGVTELSLRLPSVLLHAAQTWAVWRIGARLFDARVGLWAALLCAIHGQLLDLASGRAPTDHPESVFASLVTLAVWAAVEQARRGGLARALLTGALLGLAVQSKWLPALVVLPVWAALLPWTAAEWRRSAAALSAGLAACAAVVLPWEVWTALRFPVERAAETQHALAHLRAPLDGHAGGPFFHLARLPRFFGEASPAAIVWFAWKGPRSRAALAVALWAALPYLFFSAMATKMESYPMLAAPALCLMIAACLTAALELRQAWSTLLAAALVLLPVRFCLERWKPFRAARLERAEAAQERTLAARFARQRVLVCGAPEPIATMFYGEALLALDDARCTPEARAAAEAAGYPAVRSDAR